MHRPAANDTKSRIWELDQPGYRLACRHLGLDGGSEKLRAKVGDYLLAVGALEPAPEGFKLYVARSGDSAWELRFIDLWTGLFWPSHPWRYRLNAILAVHECDPQGRDSILRGGNARKAGLIGFGLELLATALGLPFWAVGAYIGYLLGRRRAGT